MKKILLSLLLLTSVSVYSQEDCKVCTYSRLFFFDRTRNVDFDETCPATIVVSFFFGSKTFTLTGVDDSGCNPLPIELNYFNVTLSKDNTIIQWETATEQNNDYFTIYKSYDGINWEIVEEVIGAGNTNSPIVYEIINNDLKSGTIYYKLRQTDYNGDYEEFDIKSVEYIKKELTYIIYNRHGQIVNENYDGVKIYKYSDGSFKRVLKIK